MPVTLPPGRLRLATRPASTGSSPMLKTIGMVVVAALAASAAACCRRGDDGDPTADQVGRQFRQAIVVIVRPAVFDRHVAALDVAGFAQALAECRHAICGRRRPTRRSRNPITGIAGCCARAASGHAAALPSPAMNSRRRIRSPRRRWRERSDGEAERLAFEVDDELAFWAGQPIAVGAACLALRRRSPNLFAAREAALGVRRGKAALSSGCKSHPATAPAGSNRSSHGGNEVAEAYG